MPTSKWRRSDTPQQIRTLCLLFLLSSCWNGACFAQTITIRIVDITNSKPVKNVRIYVSGVTGNTPSEREERLRLVAKPIEADLSLTTASNGAASLSLSNPAPASFYILPLLSGSHWDCTCLVHVVTEEVTKKGLVVTSPYAARGPKPSMSPQPGEVLVVLKPLPLWIRVFWPVLKG